MCDICMHSPCLSGCPNAPDPTPVTHCCSCGEPIIPGDEYGIIDGEAWCEGCLDDLPLCVLISVVYVPRFPRPPVPCGAEREDLRLERPA